LDNFTHLFPKCSFFLPPFSRAFGEFHLALFIHTCRYICISSINIIHRDWAQWCTPVIPVTQEADIAGSLSEVSLGKSMRPYLKNKLK
jgi:hypothetical protein